MNSLSLFVYLPCSTCVESSISLLVLTKPIRYKKHLRYHIRNMSILVSFCSNKWFLFPSTLPLGGTKKGYQPNIHRAHFEKIAKVATKNHQNGRFSSQENKLKSGVKIPIHLERYLAASRQKISSAPPFAFFFHVKSNKVHLQLLRLRLFQNCQLQFSSSSAICDFETL